MRILEAISAGLALTAAALIFSFLRGGGELSFYFIATSLSRINKP
ncbi:MAG: hypothetical protein ABR594_15555 [Pyrinomonadaceae bacterium]